MVVQYCYTTCIAAAAGAIPLEPVVTKVLKSSKSNMEGFIFVTPV